MCWRCRGHRKGNLEGKETEINPHEERSFVRSNRATLYAHTSIDIVCDCVSAMFSARRLLILFYFFVSFMALSQSNAYIQPSSLFPLCTHSCAFNGQNHGTHCVLIWLQYLVSTQIHVVVSLFLHFFFIRSCRVSPNFWISKRLTATTNEEEDWRKQQNTKGRAHMAYLCRIRVHK